MLGSGGSPALPASLSARNLSDPTRIVWYCIETVDVYHHCARVYMDMFTPKYTSHPQDKRRTQFLRGFEWVAIMIVAIEYVAGNALIQFYHALRSLERVKRFKE